jgi:hypothetical protein
MIRLRKVATAVTAVLLLAAIPARAQKRLEIGGWYGFQFGGQIHTDEGNVRIPNGPNFGVSIDLSIRPNAWIEVSYSRQDATVDLMTAGGGATPVYDAAVEFYQIGGLVEKGGPASLFGMAAIGVFSLNPKVPGVATETWFAASLGMGVKVPISRRLGARFQGRLLVPFLAAGGVITIAPPASSAYISSVVVVWGDISAGLYFCF